MKDNYFPLPSAAALQKARAQVEEVKAQGLIAVNSYVPGIFEHMKAFTNDEFTLVHMLEEPEDMHRLIGYTTDWLCRLYEAFARAGYDICFNGDDIGTQKSTIMGMGSYREFYKPNHRKLVEAIKAVNPQAYVAFHCCGYMHSILPEWIDVGVDIVHSVQPEANNLEFLKAQFGDKITFWGALGLQSAMFYLSLEEAREELKYCLKVMSPGGGFIAATSNYVTDEVGIEKIQLMYEVLTACGAYPHPGS